MVRVKICGITRLVDAKNAIDAGADMLGFNFYKPSPRYISPEDCTAIVSELRMDSALAHNQVTFVGVFVNHQLDEVHRIMDTCDLSLAQLSGDEKPIDLEVMGERALKVIRATENETIAEVGYHFPIRETPPAFLVDASVKGHYGGTGKTADWEQAAELAERLPILLAGGLKPGNVHQAVQRVQPWGVDAASGIEISPGVKDIAKMKQFVSEARAHNAEEIAK